MNAVAPLHRTLEQELLALLRGASLECPVCGEFVLHDGAAVRCPECELVLHGKLEQNVFPLKLDSQAG
jgi:rubrerythrin